MFELTNTKRLDAKQTAMIKAHLDMVFIHEIDPSMGSPEHQEELDKAHNPTPMWDPNGGRPVHTGFDKDTLIRC